MARNRRVQRALLDRGLAPLQQTAVMVKAAEVGGEAETSSRYSIGYPKPVYPTYKRATLS